MITVKHFVRCPDKLFLLVKKRKLVSFQLGVITITPFIRKIITIKAFFSVSEIPRS